MQPLVYKTCHYPTGRSTLCRTPHQNKKQDKNTNQIISRQDYHLTQPIIGEKKKNSAQVSPYVKLTETTAPTFMGAEIKRKKEFNFEDWEKETSNTIS